MAKQNKAEIALAQRIQDGDITYTGHAPGRDRDAIFLAAGPAERLVLVESDPDGYPLVDEQWEASRYPDGSALICTHVRGREETDFWKAIPGVNDFEIWEAA